MVAILKSLPSQSNEQFWNTYPTSSGQYCGSHIYHFKTTAESIDFLQCDPFHLKVLNHTIFSRFSFENYCHSFKKNKEKYENCMYAMTECKQVGLIQLCFAIKRLNQREVSRFMFKPSEVCNEADFWR